ncbi:Hypothetical predicted protein, partial [Paramuricea clavata]
MEKSKELSGAQKRKQRKILWEKRETDSGEQTDTGDNDIGLVVSETEIESQECTECSSGSIRQGNFKSVKLSATAESPDGDDHIGHTMSKSLDESELSTNIPVVDLRKCSELEDFDPCVTYPSDRGHFRDRLSDDLVEVLVKVGSCQPNTIINTQGGRKFNLALDLKFFSVKRNWFSCSEKLGTVYCHNCWLLAKDTSRNKDTPWIDGFFSNTNHLKQQIETHEESMTHKEATKHYAHIKAGKGVSRLKINEAGIAKAKNFWREVLHRMIVIILTLASLSLPLRGHREFVGNGKCEGGNFLGLVNMQLK